eukprot:scaffold92564_cov20-Tisochrysis_lutea.AAC.3
MPACTSANLIWGNFRVAHEDHVACKLNRGIRASLLQRGKNPLECWCAQAGHSTSHANGASVCRVQRVLCAEEGWIGTPGLVYTARLVGWYGPRVA